MLSNRTEALEIAVRKRAGDLFGEKTERAQFRINRRFITTKDWTGPGGIAGIRRCSRPDLERHTPDKGDEMNRQCLHPFVSIGRLVDVPPLPLVENSPQGIGNGCVVLLARDFLLGRTIEFDKVVSGYPAFFRVKFRECFRIGNGGVENDDCLRR